MPDSIDQAITAALKNITDVDTLGASVLSTEHLDALIRTVQDEAVLLGETRLHMMEAQRTRVDRVGFSERVMVPGRASNGDHRDIPDGEVATPEFADVELIARELVAVTSLRDYAARRSIEREGLEQTIIDLIGGAAGRDLEEYALLAGTTDGDAFLEQTEGWIASAANAVYVPDEGSIDDDDPEAIFDAAIEATPTRFIGDPTEWLIACDFRTFRQYLAVLRNRQTSLGDEAQQGRIPLAYEGFGVQYVPMLERAKGTGDGGPGRVAVMMHPDNAIWGVFEEVTVEPDRFARERRTEMVLTAEVDAKWEDPNGATVVYLDKSEPA